MPRMIPPKAYATLLVSASVVTIGIGIADGFTSKIVAYVFIYISLAALNLYADRK